MCVCVCACVCDVHNVYVYVHVCVCAYFDYCMITPSSSVFSSNILSVTLHTSSYRAAENNGGSEQHLIVINPAHIPGTGVHDRVENSPNMLAHNNAGTRRPHTSVPSHVNTSQQPTYDSLEKPRQNREPQPYQVPIRTKPAVPQDNLQYAEPCPQETVWRLNMQHRMNTLSRL